MARASGVEPRGPISRTAEMVPGKGLDSRLSLASKPTLGDLVQRLRADRRVATRLANHPTRLHELATAVLENDEAALEMFADGETLAAYLSALIEKWLRSPSYSPCSSKPRAA